MANDLELKVRIGAELKELRQALQSVQGDLRNLGNEVKKSTSGGSQGFNGLESSIRSIKNQVVGLVAGFAGLQGVKTLARMADEARLFDARLRLATKTQEDFNTAQAATFDIAQRTRSGLTQTVELYSKLALATKEYDVAQGQLLAVTETVNKAVQLSGASAEASQASIIQLAQGLASGTLRGEELNSVMEQTPRLAQAIAEGMGIGIGELRKMGQEGKITADTVINALLSQTQKIDGEFQKLPVTFDQAFTQLRNSVTQAVGDFDRATGSFSGLAQVVSDFATGIASDDFLGPLIESFVSLRETARATFTEVNTLVGAFALGLEQRLGEDGAEAVDFLTFSLKNLPAIVRGAIQRAVIEIAYFFDTMILDAQSVAQKIKAIFSDDTSDAVEARYAASAKALAEARQGSIDAIRDEIAAHSSAGEAARARFRKEREEREKTRQDAAKKTTAAAGTQIQGNRTGTGVGDGVIDQLALQKQAIDQQIREQDRLYRAGQLGIRAYYDERKRLAAEMAVVEQQEIERKIKAADTVDEKNKAVTERELARRRAAAEQTDLTQAEQEANAGRLRDAEKLEADLLSVQGKGAQARRLELEAQYRDMLQRMKAEGDTAGIEIVNALINSEVAGERVKEVEKQIQDALNQQTLREEDVGRQQEIGAVSDFGASAEINASRETTIQQLRTMREELVLLAEQGAPGAKDAIGELDQRINQMGVTAPSIFKQIAQGASQSLGDAFADIITGAKSASDAFRDFGRSFAAMLAQMAAQALASMAIFAALRALGVPLPVLQGMGLMGAGVKHTGGVVGQGGTIRQVDPSLFLAAPRYHVGGVAGLKPGEVPAILQTGEEVLARNDPRNVMNGGGQQQGGSTRIINVIDPNLVADYMTSSAGEETLVNLIQRNAGSIKQVLT